jgi:hypothetical protein
MRGVGYLSSVRRRKRRGKPGEDENEEEENTETNQKKRKKRLPNNSFNGDADQQDYDNQTDRHAVKARQEPDLKTGETQRAQTSDQPKPPPKAPRKPKKEIKT